MPPNPPSFRYRLEFAAFSLLGRLMAMLPVEFSSDLMAKAMRRVGPLIRGRYARIENNLALAYPDMAAVERRALATRVCEHVGRLVAEFFHADEIIRDRLSCDNPEVLERLARSGQGCVICGGHQANWEACTGIMVRHGLKPMGIYHPMSNPFSDAYFKRRRAVQFPGGLAAKRDPATPIRVMRFAARGGAVAFMIDQYMHASATVPFFGRPAATTTLPAMIARSRGLPLVLLHCVRQPGVRFTVVCEEIPVPVTDDQQADILEATAAAQAALEVSIRARPEQWLWTHRRWGWDQ